METTTYTQILEQIEKVKKQIDLALTKNER